MLTKPNLQNKNKDITARVVGGVTEEMEKFTDSVNTQITGDVKPDQPSPITEAMQQKTTDEEADKKNKTANLKKYIRSREELNNDLKAIRQKLEEQKKVWSEDVDRQFKIISPGQKMQGRQDIPLSLKPKRGHMPGTPGTAKGETGPEVRRSKQ